jgi:hypothetical protein
MGLFSFPGKKIKISETSHRGEIPEPLRALRPQIVDYPAPSHLLRFHFVGCTKEVSNT